jgi:hypothetical protein
MVALADWPQGIASITLFFCFVGMDFLDVVFVFFFLVSQDIHALGFLFSLELLYIVSVSCISWLMQPKWKELRIIKWATRKTIAAQVEKMDPEIKRIFKKPPQKKT